MKITLITSCYNAEEFLAETIDSVISQRGNFILEYIIIDNKSTDSTPKIIESYLQKKVHKQLSVNCKELQIKHIREADTGLYDALAKGFSMATGDVIGYLNANDILFPNALSTVCEVFSVNQNIQWLTGQPVVLNEQGQPVYWIMPFKYSRALTRQGFNLPGRLFFLQQESTFWRKELLQNVPMDQFRKLRLAGDYFLWFCFAKTAELYQLRSFLGASRTHKNRLSDQLKDYIKEVDSFTEPKSFTNKIKARLYYFATILLIDKAKMLLNKRILHYQENSWQPRPNKP